MTRAPLAWRLSSHLTALLMTTITLTLLGVATAVVVWRIPIIERKAAVALQIEVREFSQRLELMLSAAQARLETLQRLLDATPAAQAEAILDDSLRAKPSFAAIYRLSPRGRVSAIGLAPAWRARRSELRGADLSENHLYQLVLAGPGVAWQGRMPSALAGARTVGVGVRDRQGRVMLAELPVHALTETVQVAAGSRASSLWVVERNGELVVDTDAGQPARRDELRAAPFMQALLNLNPAPEMLDFQGRRYHAAVAHAPALGWVVVGRAPTGLHNPQVRVLLMYAAAAFVGCLLTALIVTPIWARRMAQPLRRILDSAARASAGQAGAEPWPHGPVLELNRLSDDLQALAQTLQHREQQSIALFNASPVAMSVADENDGGRLVDVNLAWLRDFGWRREEVIGRTAVEVGLWSDASRAAFLREQAGGRVAGEATFTRANGEPLQAQVVAERVALGRDRWLIWAVLDIGPLRRVEQALRELNQDLEARVVQRTQALASTHDELSATLAQLRAAQAALVQTGTMAALGQLVAGVAHEVNTPLGNGVMAISAMAAETSRFRTALPAGLRRADLAAFIDSIEQGTALAERNLQRAAELVQSFKQVAVDQTSAQRRRFELAEVVHEIVVSLRAGFARTAWRIEIDVPATGLLLDSYPGALGQALASLLHNAVQHGFDGRDHGTVRITGGRLADGRIVMRVTDDGVGMAAGLVEHVFEPFVTKRMGRGGTGLGLHISYQAVTRLLGGTLTVHSVPGAGSTFELQLPARAPADAARPAT
jgi:PAS domain S-box-containing protein